MKFTIFLGSLIAAALFSTASALGATVISVTPASQTVSSGDSVSVSITIAGVNTGTALAVGAFDFDVLFDPTLLGFGSASFGSQLDVLGLGDIQIVTPSSGSINLFELSLDAPSDLAALQASDFTLATLTFTTLTAGLSPIDISVNALADGYGATLPTSVLGGSVNISAAVPEPEAYALMLAGLGILALMAYCRQRKLSAWARPCPPLTRSRREWSTSPFQTFDLYLLPVLSKRAYSRLASITGAGVIKRLSWDLGRKPICGVSQASRWCARLGVESRKSAEWTGEPQDSPGRHLRGRGMTTPSPLRRVTPGVDLAATRHGPKSGTGPRASGVGRPVSVSVRFDRRDSLIRIGKNKEQRQTDPYQFGIGSVAGSRGGGNRKSRYES